MKKKAIIATCLSLVLLFALTGVVWAASIPYQSITTSDKFIGSANKQTASSTGTVTVSGVSTETIRWVATLKSSSGSTYGSARAYGNATVHPKSGQIGTSIRLYMKCESSTMMVNGTWNP